MYRTYVYMYGIRIDKKIVKFIRISFITTENTLNFYNYMGDLSVNTVNLQIFVK